MTGAWKLPTRLPLDSVETYRTPGFERAGFLRLDVNEHAEGTPADIVSAVAASLTPHTLATYPQYADWHREAGRWFGVGPDELTCTAGGDEAIKAICECFLLPGKPLLMPEPGFDLFGLWAAIYGSGLRGVPLGAGFAFDAEAWLAALDGDLGMVVLTSPNNPTATLVPEDVLEATLVRVRCPVLVDETYIEFAGQGSARWIATNPHLFVVRSFSKVHGLAGLRIGAVLSQAHNIAQLRKVIPPFSVARPAIAASLAVMARPELLEAHVRAVVAVRDEFAADLDQLGIAVGPCHANFLLAHLGPDAGLQVEALAREGILVRNRTGTHPDLQGWVRIGIGSAAQMTRVIGALRKIRLPAPTLDALIFDMDGPLVDTSGSYRVAILHTVRTLLSRYGAGPEVLARVTPELVESFKRRGGLNNDWHCAQAMIAEMGGAVGLDQVVEAFQSLYWGEDGDGLIAGEPFLVDPPTRALLATRFKTAIVTGRPRAEALMTLNLSGAVDTWPPERVVAMEDGPTKPAPDGILRMVFQLGTSPERSAYLGDSVDDMRAARAAGVLALGILPAGSHWGDGLAERLAQAGAFAVFRSVGEVLTWLEG